MPAFVTRVVLQDADREEYEKLHEYMAAAGFSKNIVGRESVWELPDATYRYRTDDKAVGTKEVNAKAVEAATKTRKRHSVITFETVNWSSHNLTRASKQ